MLKATAVHVYLSINRGWSTDVFLWRRVVSREE